MPKRESAGTTMMLDVAEVYRESSDVATDPETFVRALRQGASTLRSHVEPIVQPERRIRSAGNLYYPANKAPAEQLAAALRHSARFLDSYSAYEQTLGWAADALLQAAVIERAAQVDMVANVLKPLSHFEETQSSALLTRLDNKLSGKRRTLKQADHKAAAIAHEVSRRSARSHARKMSKQRAVVERARAALEAQKRSLFADKQLTQAKRVLTGAARNMTETYVRLFSEQGKLFGEAQRQSSTLARFRGSDAGCFSSTSVVTTVAEARTPNRRN